MLTTIPLFLLIALMGQSADVPDPVVEKDRQERLKYMTEQLERVVIQTTGTSPKTLTRMEKPVLRYTNPIRSSAAGGATFLWLDNQRPVVAASISIRQNNNVLWEFASLSNEEVSASRNEVAFWTPKQPSRPAELLPDAAEPASQPSLRLTQLRNMARRFTVTVEKGKWQETRLLPQPLHRWGQADTDILDGALFCFAETTDPEALLLIEAKRNEPSQKYNWYFTLAKMTSPPVKVELDQNSLWSFGGYWKNARSPEDAYMEAVIGNYEPAADKK